MLDALLEQALRGWSSITLCGGSPADFKLALDTILKHQPAREHWLKLEAGQELAAVDFLRAALRQDPDCIVLDQRGSECLDTQLQAAATGHRLISGHPQSPAQALAGFCSCNPEFSLVMVAGILQYALFLEVGERGEVASVHQLQIIENEPRLVELARIQEGAWLPLHDASWPAPYQPPAPDYTPIEVPAEWGSREESLLASLRRLRRPRQRLTWAPRLVPFEGDSHRGSRYGGLPSLRAGESWPRCQACQTRMQLVVQIECQHLPEALHQQIGPGLFQFFYCISDTCSVAEAWAPYAGNSLARQIEATDLLAPARDDRPESSPYSVFLVEEWQPLPDHPDGEETSEEEQTPLSYVEDWSEMVEGSARSEGLYQRYSRLLDHFQVGPEHLAEVVSLLHNYPGDKLLGWPRWTQGVEYPACQKCGQTMDMVLQVNNDGNPDSRPGFHSCFGQLFAGDGNGHVFRCPDHREVMTFSWACG